MNATAIFEQLANLGVTVTAEGDKIILEPGSRVPSALLTTIREHKPELLARLTERCQTEPQAKRDSVGLPVGWQDAVDAWLRSGCPKGDPVMMGLSLLALQKLAALPVQDRLTHLRDWRTQIRQRAKDRREEDGTAG